MDRLFRSLPTPRWADPCPTLLARAPGGIDALHNCGAIVRAILRAWRKREVTSQVALDRMVC